MSPLRAMIVREVENFMLLTGWSSYRLGRAAAGDPRLLAKLKTPGWGMRLTAIEAMLAVMKSELERLAAVNAQDHAD